MVKFHAIDENESYQLEGEYKVLYLDNKSYPAVLKFKGGESACEAKLTAIESYTVDEENKGKINKAPSAKMVQEIKSTTILENNNAFLQYEVEVLRARLV